MTYPGQDSAATGRAASLAPPLQRLHIEKIAVFRALQIGDMLCAVPALRALRAAFPQAHITLIGLPWAAQFARRFHSYIDDFVAFPGHPALPEQPAQEERIPGFYRDMRERGFDLALQLHGSGQISNAIVRGFGARENAGFVLADDSAQRAALFVDYPEQGAEPLRLLHLPRHLGAPADDTDLEFPLIPEDEQELRAAGIGAGLQPGRYICIHPGARMRRRCWPPQLFAQVADTIASEYGMPVVLTGAGSEADLTAAIAGCMRTPAVDAARPMSLGAMAALMSKARLLVCNDTGVSHLASGLKLPSVVVFGTADMERWGPIDRELHRCVRGAEGAEAILAQARALLDATDSAAAPTPVQ
ncbi:glycosyltransferase family 9 protein [Noviherbaspirillum sp. UKPF54]|uniref:glycosyltransferase family 9 protein n=1 Tax=Noviherbaspirillum sp. UKPF54 TaxID=2601898 RepID=UPI0011B1AA8C|nr:glycosyltransferase family 9 protein [Noviherbaspirillum sp. UKPF54]QDZ27672.1 glycosyltransferase family 9 protein [Noviherbaspirillum sp. UKPF54]